MGVWLTTSRDEDIPAIWISRPNAHFTFLFSHGNAEDLGLIVQYFRQLARRLTVNILAYEYTGYGQSTGVPEEESVYADIEAAFKYLRDEKRIPWNQIVAYGRSIGTGPTVHLASKTALRGIVLQSPMASIFRIPWRFRFTMPGDLFTNIDKVSDVSCPVFVMHGTKDEIVPCWHGKAIYDVCAKKGIAYDPFLVPGADHNGLESHAGETFQIQIQQYLTPLKHTSISPDLQEQAARS